MENEIIVGLDIGTTKIACFVGIRSENGMVKILGYGKTDSDGVEHGIVRNVELAGRSVRKAVEQAANQANVDIDEVWVGVAGQHIKSRPSHGYITIPADHQLITEEDVERLKAEQYKTMLEPGEEIIHVIPQKYIVDRIELSREIPPVGVAGKTLEAEFHMVTANVINLQNIKYAVQSAGLTIKDVVLEPFASSLAVLDDSDRDAGVAMVDIGGGTTDIAIFYNGIIRHTSVLALAGNAITNDIRENCAILRNQAESLKVKFGSCLVQAVSENDVISIPGIRSQTAREISVKTLASIINIRTKMIMEQVDYEIKLSGYQKKLIGGVVLTGGGAKLNNIKDLCSLITATETRIGIPNEHLDPASAGYDELAHPMYATGIGLVIYGLDKTEKQKTGNNTETNEETPANPHDIFADMPDTIEPAPIPETDTTNSNRKGGTPGGKKAFKAIGDFFKTIILDEGLDNGKD
ncbi:MAG: cell division protein FtsA [Bacteroidales bacterium]|nr:cell division protein FtsA [Bacteroidales bacterium]